MDSVLHFVQLAGRDASEGNKQSQTKTGDLPVSVDFRQSLVRQRPGTDVHHLLQHPPPFPLPLSIVISKKPQKLSIAL